MDPSFKATTILLSEGLKAIAYAVSNFMAPFVGTYLDHDN